MGRLIRTHDWASTPLGPIEGWPQSLKTAVGIMLSTRHPVFIHWGNDLRCLYNDAFAESLGPEKHPSILGMPARQAWPETYPVVGAQLEQVMSGGEATWAENHPMPVTRNGRVEEVYWTYSYGPIPDPDAPNGVGGVLVLTAETTQAVIAQRESEERYRILFESMDEGFCVLQLIFDEQDRPIEYRYIEINPAFEQQTGMRDALGKTIRKLVPGVEPFWFDIYGKVALTGEPTRFVDHAKAMGRWFNVYAFRVGEPHQRQVGVLFSDITKHKEAEANLRQSEARHRQIINSATDYAIIASDLDGRVTSWNEGARRLLGWSEDEMLGQPVHLFFTPEDVAADEPGNEMRSALESGRGIDERWHQRKSGERFWACGELTPLKDDEGV
ncbi:MAG TPA: PAS domain S-box protein, partial [Chloroflexia bacterium]|nr:PAS domain S-box protein [Chloroflexia bacterium]